MFAGFASAAKLLTKPNIRAYTFSRQGERKTRKADVEFVQFVQAVQMAGFAEFVEAAQMAESESEIRVSLCMVRMRRMAKSESLYVGYKRCKPIRRYKSDGTSLEV